MKSRIYLILLCLLVISLQAIAKDYKGAEYRTKASFLYGRFEVRMKSFQKDGALASFFTYYDQGGGSWNEIDIEIMGRYSNNVQFNTIVPSAGSNHVHRQPAAFNPSTDFHTYAIEWTPNNIIWFIDSIEVYRQSGSHIQQMNLAQKIMMNVWPPAASGWSGKWNDAVLPAFAYYDWVSYFEYTPGKGNYGTGNDFTFSWKDDFNIFDTNRWAKATHTFDGNNCDFITDNAVIKDGMLILCLTDNVNTGYTDLKAPAPLWCRTGNNKVQICFSEQLDKASAETPSNYILDGVSVNSVKLLDDQKTVELSLSGFNADVNTYALVMNVKDKAVPNANKMAGVRVNLIKSNSLKFPVKINCGGPAVNGFLADQEWTPETEYGYMDGWNQTASRTVQGGSEPAVYKDAHYDMACYRIRVPNGSYNVKLMMAENGFSSPGQRIFNVYTEGELVLFYLDLYSKAGDNAAYERTISNVEVKDEILDIDFGGHISQPVISGIIIESNSTGILNEGVIAPGSFSLEQNYPNPFNGMTKIKFTLKEKDNIQFNVFDTLGRVIYSKELGEMDKGENSFAWKASDSKGNALNSGVYFYSITGNEGSITKKLILLN